MTGIAVPWTPVSYSSYSALCEVTTDINTILLDTHLLATLFYRPLQCHAETGPNSGNTWEPSRA